MKTERDIENILNESRPKLDVSSRARLWSHIEKKLLKTHSVPSPFLFSFLYTRTMIPVLLMMLVIVSTGGVAVASETARPGDLLFPVERAFESARLSVAFSPEKKDALMKQYSDERLEEFRTIIEEEIRLRTVDQDSTQFSDALIPIESEDRKDRVDDRGENELSSEGSVRVGSALTEVLTFIDESEENDDDTAEFLKELRSEIHGLNIEIDDERIKERGAKSRFEWKTDNNIHDDAAEDSKIKTEWRDDGARVRIEEKNGRVRIDIKEEDGWNDGHKDDDESDTHENENETDSDEQRGIDENNSEKGNED